jgi:hypothetical protein
MTLPVTSANTMCRCSSGSSLLGCTDRRVALGNCRARAGAFGAGGGTDHLGRIRRRRNCTARGSGRPGRPTPAGGPSGHPSYSAPPRPSRTALASSLCHAPPAAGRCPLANTVTADQRPPISSCLRADRGGPVFDRHHRRQGTHPTPLEASHHPRRTRVPLLGEVPGAGAPRRHEASRHPRRAGARPLLQVPGAGAPHRHEALRRPRRAGVRQLG